MQISKEYMVFLKAETGPPLAEDPPAKFTVRYFDENGNLTIRSGGSRAWRCNNPGNLRKSRYSMSKKRGSIGFAGHGEDQYPVYPDKATGLEALTVMLKGSVYGPLTLRKALQRFEPGKTDYIDIIVQRTGLDPDHTIRSLNDREFTRFHQAIEYVENWTPGCEDFIERWIIAAVHKKRGTIFEYLVNKPKSGGSEWIAKTDAILLADEGRLRATVVHPKKGSPYLRPEYGKHSFTEVT